MQFRQTILFILFPLTAVLAQEQAPPVGEWREHLPYHSMLQLEAGNGQVIAATPYSLLHVDTKTGESSLISKANGLTESKIQTLFYDSLRQELWIAYQNSQVDVLAGSRVDNLPGLYRENLPGDKRIFQFYKHDDLYYLATGFGILQLDPARKEFRDAWYLGKDGAALGVRQLAFAADRWYALTDSGLLSCSTAVNPANPLNWAKEGGLTAPEQIRNLNGNIYVLQRDSILVLKSGLAELVYTSDWPVLDFSVSGDYLLMAERKADGQARIIQADRNGLVVQTYRENGSISLPREAVLYDGALWLADEYGGLSAFTSGGNSRHFEVPGPEGIASAEMKSLPGKLLIASGSVNASWNYQYNGNGVYLFAAGSWKNLNRFKYPVLDSMLDFITVAFDPRDQSIWAGSYGGGLLHASADAVPLQIYKQNSAISEAIGDPGSYRVSGLAFDVLGNLWVSNYGAAAPLHVLKPDGSWLSFQLPFSLTENAISTLLFDEHGHLWIISPKRNGLLVYDPGASLESTADDRWKRYTEAEGLPGNDVYSLVQDKTGNLWIGTNNGMAVITCTEDPFSAQCRPYWPVVASGQFAGLLFKNESVNGIAVDGANRKWVATGKAVWLLNAEADEVLAQFTSENSPLLSNLVHAVAIEPKTGEVFFATSSGISSYRARASEANLPDNPVSVFPNPVPPEFEGEIAVRGLPENAVIRIVDPSGRLVFQTRALGGQATWNAKDLKGNRVASGVYLLISREEFGRAKQLAKIVVISK